MDNNIKMRIKSIPGLSDAAMLFNRTVVRRLRVARNLPAMKRENAHLLETLSALEPDEPRIWYFGVPIHPNLGDQAQKCAILGWLSREYPSHDVVKMTTRSFNGNPGKTLDAIGRVIKPEDILVMQSGHTMDGIHPDETAHRLVARTFGENRLVFFPTSISFLSKSGMVKDVRALNGRQKTLLLARDPVSFETAQRIYPGVDVRLFPDIVTSLIGTYRFNTERHGTLLCLRNDGERVVTAKEADELMASLGKLDHVDVFDTNVDKNMGDLPLDSLQREIDAAIGDFARYRAVVTDRYHGVIFSRIASTPVVTLKTIDHKVLSSARWFIDEGDAGVAIAESPHQAPGLAAALMERFPDGIDAPRFAEDRYRQLKDLIEDM